MKPASVAAPRSSSRPARLRPKEHGAYAVLLIPIVTSSLVAGPTLVGACVAVAALSGFFAHEPLLVACGYRGRRQREATPHAKSRVAILLVITMLAGTAAMALASLPIRAALIGSLLLAVSSFAMALTGHHHTLPGQIWGVMGLSAPGVLILLAGGRDVGTGISVWAVWLVGFFATTTAVHSLIAAQKRRSRWSHGSLLATLSLVTCFLMPVRLEWSLAALPMIFASWILLIWPPPAKHLKSVGWALVAATTGTGLLIVQTFL